MNDFGKLLLIVALATFVNVTARVREGKEPVSPIIGAGVLLTMLGIVGAIWRWDIVIIMAVLFLVSSLVIKGVPTVQALNQLISGVRND